MKLLKVGLLISISVLSFSTIANETMKFHPTGNPLYDNDVSGRFVKITQDGGYPDIIIDTKTGCEFFENIGDYGGALFTHSCDPNLIAEKFKNK